MVPSPKNTIEFSGLEEDPLPKFLPNFGLPTAFCRVYGS